jgi:hypothetical protein
MAWTFWDFAASGETPVSFDFAPFEQVTNRA